MENQKLLMSVQDVINATGIGKTTVFGLVRSGALRPTRIGGRTFFRPEDLKAFIDNAESSSASNAA